MDTSEKVKIFDSFENLTQEIIKDRETHDMLAQRYAIRFIMLNNFNEFKQLAKFMSNIGVDSLDLENLLEEGEDDTWITKDMLKDAVKSCHVSTFITPFSEIVRFYNDDDFRGFFNEIMLLEDIHNPQKRIYVPLIGLQNRFTDFLNHFARLKESAPIWRYDAEIQSVEVYFTKYKNFVLPNEEEQCQLDSLREWLKFWKVQAPQERIVCTSMPIAAKYKYSKPDNIFNFTKIANAYEFMTQFLDLSFPFEYHEEDRRYWELLLEKIDKKKVSTFSFESFIKAYFNKVKFGASDILSEWNNSNSQDFERWLLKNFVQNTKFGCLNPYISLCVDSVTNLSDSNQLVTFIATRMLYETESSKRDLYVKERRSIIRDNHLLFEKNISESEQKWISDRTIELFQKHGDLNEVIDLCTGVFDFEKVLLIGWYANHPESAKLKSTINELYPDFAWYITNRQPSNFKESQAWSLTYFEEYKQAKLQDKYLPEIEKFIKTRNNSQSNFYKWFFAFRNSHSVLSELLNSDSTKPDKVFWIDGLGVEFLSYILNFIENENSDLKVTRSEITSSYLPTSTNHNRYEGELVKKYGALDELGHDSKGYRYLYTLKDELKIIKEIVTDILAYCKNKKCTVAIVSDHGLSCLSRKVISKKYDGKFEHEGRYITTTESAECDSDYIVHKNEEENQFYKVALTHSSLSKVPTHQVHGGCTPEEVLVPFIVLSNMNVSSINYQIKLSDDDIMLSNPLITLTVIPEPKQVELTYKGKVYLMNRVGTQWNTKLEDITEGDQTIQVKPEDSESKEFKIKVIGVGSSSSINDMMDDF